MGLFGAYGVVPVHQNLQDAGLAFDSIGDRTVAIHGEAFSPENAQFQLSDTVPIAHFFSYAYSPDGRQVLTFHILPETDQAGAQTNKNKLQPYQQHKEELSIACLACKIDGMLCFLYR